ncbi:MAG: PhoH family protein [Deltaproteobacteria bacterium]|nr:PhoH family protein [Deltaproteobacteria bacterium]
MEPDRANGRLLLDDGGVARILVGPNNGNLRVLEEASGASISARGTELVFSGEEDSVELVRQVLQELYELVREGRPLYASDVERAYRVKSQDKGLKLREIFMDTVFVANRKRIITPQGIGQKRYIEAMRKYDVVFGIGPAGTGKTYLAMAMGVAALKNQEVKRIVITRPAVEAGEKLGFLPGDLAEKVNPYLRPLYDALHDMMEYDQVTRLMERGTVEVAPLAFMRGRTLNDSFVVLDEAQNTTSDQMKMFLTRLGYDSRAVITGDVTQVDLPPGQRCGLLEATRILADIENIAFCTFDEQDVVRHPLVQEVIRAYDRYERQQERGDREGGHGER